LNYENVDPFPLKEQMDKPISGSPEEFFRVEQMKFAKNGKEKDKTTILYNSRITLSGVPLEAYEYVVNGKPALEWVMERYAVTIEKDSGIKKRSEHLVRGGPIYCESRETGCASQYRDHENCEQLT
ncbi:helicase/methyltransferase, partial [mine drainage metagenome]